MAGRYVVPVRAVSATLRRTEPNKSDKTPGAAAASLLELAQEERTVTVPWKPRIAELVPARIRENETFASLFLRAVDRCTRCTQICIVARLTRVHAFLDENRATIFNEFSDVRDSKNFHWHPYRCIFHKRKINTCKNCRVLYVYNLV